MGLEGGGAAEDPGIGVEVGRVPIRKGTGEHSQNAPGQLKIYQVPHKANGIEELGFAAVEFGQRRFRGSGL